MQTLKKSNLKNSIILSKMCFGPGSKEIDPTNFDHLLGFRQSSFFLINPFLCIHSLKMGLSLLKSFLKSNYKPVFIIKLENLVLLQKFQIVCKKRRYVLLQDLDVGAGFLTKRKRVKTVLVTLFLDGEKAELVRSEAASLNIPVISFGSLAFNRASSLIFVGANYNSFPPQNLILTLLSICLHQKHANT
jgi:hypothetical protein